MNIYRSTRELDDTFMVLLDDMVLLDGIFTVRLDGIFAVLLDDLLKVLDEMFMVHHGCSFKRRGIKDQASFDNCAH